MPTIDEASEETPHYYVSPSLSVTGGSAPPRESSTCMVIADEGWRQSVVCSGMYRWAADWLVEQLQGKPFAPGRRP